MGKGLRVTHQARLRPSTDVDALGVNGPLNLRPN